MDYPKIIAAFLIGGRIILHRQTSDDTLEAAAITPDDARWMQAAEAVRHFAKSNTPLADLTG